MTHSKVVSLERQDTPHECERENVHPSDSRSNEADVTTVNGGDGMGEVKKRAIILTTNIFRALYSLESINTTCLH